MTQHPTLLVEGLQYTYPQGGGLVRADLAASEGTLTAIEGPSGSGKSTLLALLGLILVPQAGTVRIEGTDTTALTARERDDLRHRSIGIVLQDLGLLPFLNAWENVAAAFGSRLTYHKRPARRMLAALDLAQLAGRPVQELSGGQRQRVAVARAAVKQPALILADEPTSGLDPQTAAAVTNALRHCADQGAAVVLVTHDKTLAVQCDKRYTLEAGTLPAPLQPTTSGKDSSA
ncbi:ABC transporter ATP-binding protein [Streptomyces sp. NPDC019539]|uniref:ABC transporter ATP-binding protein n=1 Tax=Streptomyces sp. NPDC019539 TaxID=3365063 RepID=UPI0037900413